MSSTRLYVGNLAASCDEFTLLKLCAQHGKIAKLDYLFHKSGPAKGKPRGYAFVEYATKEEARKAMIALHDKLVRGRKIIVTAASEQSTNPDDVRLAALTGKGNTRPRTNDKSRPTPISLLKGQGVAAAKSTNGKIAALEAKLAALRRNKPEEEEPDHAHEPIASTSTLPADAEGWLETLLHPEMAAGAPSVEGEGEGDARVDKEGEAAGGGAKRPAPAEDVSEDERKRRKLALDKKVKAAGLPTRPAFDAPEPTPRES
ncbi:hypothetical protein RQP46_001131 [Phenoliferia psychrophenolica]